MVWLFGRPRPCPEEIEVDELVRGWERACEGAGLVRVVDTVTGPTVLPPKVTHVLLGSASTGPTVLTVRLQPGQTIADVRAAAPRLAPHLGVYGLRVESRGAGQWALVTLLSADPLGDTVPMPGVISSNRSIFLGRLDDGTDLIADLRSEGHVCCQGATRSGKSVLTYSLLAQVAGQPDVLVAGSDPTGLLFRPFAGTRHEPWQASGLACLDDHERVLYRLVHEMDRRISQIPPHRDTIETDQDTPLILVVLEELAGLYRAADAASPQQAKRVRGLISRLLAEGAKAGIRVLIIIQRAEANLLGAFERSNCAVRISFRTENRQSVELLHPGADPVIADAHTSALPGVALVSAPGRPLSRMRAPWFGDYAAYVSAVKAAA